MVAALMDIILILSNTNLANVVVPIFLLVQPLHNQPLFLSNQPQVLLRQVVHQMLNVTPFVLGPIFQLLVLLLGSNFSEVLHIVFSMLRLVKLVNATAVAVRVQEILNRLVY